MTSGAEMDIPIPAKIRIRSTDRLTANSTTGPGLMAAGKHTAVWIGDTENDRLGRLNNSYI